MYSCVRACMCVCVHVYSCVCVCVCVCTCKCRPYLFARLALAQMSAVTMRSPLQCPIPLHTLCHTKREVRRAAERHGMTDSRFHLCTGKRQSSALPRYEHSSQTSSNWHVSPICHQPTVSSQMLLVQSAETRCGLGVSYLHGCRCYTKHTKVKIRSLCLREDPGGCR